MRNPRTWRRAPGTLLVMIIMIMAASMALCEDPAIDPEGTWLETPWGVPVIDRGASGAWDHNAVDNPFVYYEDNVYYAFYEGMNSSSVEQIGLAISADGVNWEKQSLAAPLLSTGASGSWDSRVTKLPTGVVKKDGLYYLYYTGGDPTGTRHIGMAFSDQLTGGWTKYATPVLEGRPGQWDALVTSYPAAVQEIDGQYHMLYRGLTGFWHNQAVGLTISDDLVHWTRHPAAQSTPLTDPSEEIASLGVTKVNDQYVGISQPMDLANRAYWYSTDLVTWRKGEPVSMQVLSSASTLSNPFLVGDTWNILYEQDDRIYQAVLMPPEPPPEPGLIAHWTFDQDGSDSAGQNHGIFHGGAHIVSDAKVGAGCLALDFKSKQYVTVDDLAGKLATGQAMTMTLWFNTTRRGSTMINCTDNVLFSAHVAGGNTNLMRVGTGVEGGVYLNPTDIPGSEPDEERGSGLNDGQWHFLAVTLAEDGKSTVWIGNPEGNLDEITGFTDQAGQPKWDLARLFSFGQEWDGATPSNFYDGKIDDVHLWNYTLSEQQLQGVYRSVVGIPGDLNNDGFVGGDDLDIVRSFWGQTVDVGDLSSGDPSGDGFVGGDDLDYVRAHWGEGTPPDASLRTVSEPTLWGLVALGGSVALLWRIRRGKRRSTVPMILLMLSLAATVANADEPPMNPDWIWRETPWGKPAIDRGPAGAWDHYAVDNPYVHVEKGKFYCFFEAQDKPFDDGGHERFGLAMSEDGLHWRKNEKPLLNIGAPGEWDSIVTKLPAGVIQLDDTYYLFYSGRNNTTKQIGMATSSSLTGPWAKAAVNPVLNSRSQHWDKHISTYPSPVFQLGEKYYLLFRGMTGFYRRQGVGAAVSTDLVHWRRADESVAAPLTALDEELASFAVTKIRDQFVAISQPMNLSRRAYWYSTDLLEWKKGPKVRFHASVVAETLSNPFVVDGQWNILYEQKDRIHRAVLMPPTSDATASEASRGD